MATKITKEERDKLSVELEKLKKKDRPQVARDLKEAISQGDLSENAAYSEAKERQSEIETRVREIEQKLANAEIIEEGEGSDGIEVGSLFKVIDEDTKQERSFSIVGPEVSSPSDGKVSFDSPIGSAFLGRKEGDLVEVTTPGGKRKYRVLKVK
ncbi:MAG: hypothetical protein A3B96_02725 [Candidatus Spechtbacteria bacterium RIFCSPHIGHO2_02_FULL_43_15b]|uniref:Transcription elongation factor GreA n=1 Tax=Candidatus Spechtbacteria bacterium RIFCSPHIGHO2_01_FULL_43_30 TaxID=1802158 RepID=A0A1G2H6P8_9BACT|nr:MAG: hypothetical protein A2827_02880 [Candidatus Spechtbacteria bacterium RIFCSPHIGHO2_01_FULL_43_30]OGZ60212.1 MAG: hypothetical protein A3B96_02725 [Candidatus Spechtbacteria bacterium RIFCSPHIGHO2_02_FULL_43_15b]